MKVFSIVATIFVVLTFLAGTYGMNFDHMPELHWWAYPIIQLTMLVVAVGMIAFFRRKGWLGARAPVPREHDVAEELVDRPRRSNRRDVAARFVPWASEKSHVVVR